jgi:hypothetical protein
LTSSGGFGEQSLDSLLTDNEVVSKLSSWIFGKGKPGRRHSDKPEQYERFVSAPAQSAKK